MGIPEVVELPFEGEDIGAFDNGMPISADWTLNAYYHLCVMIDPDDLVDESSEDDNFFTGEYGLLEILDPVSQCSVARPIAPWHGWTSRRSATRPDLPGDSWGLAHDPLRTRRQPGLVLKERPAPRRSPPAPA